MFREAVPVLARVPDLKSLAFFDMETAFQADKERVLAPMRELGVRIGRAGLSPTQVQHYEQLRSMFGPVPEDPFLLGPDGVPAPLQRIACVARPRQRRSRAGAAQPAGAPRRRVVPVSDAADSDDYGDEAERWSPSASDDDGNDDDHADVEFDDEPQYQDTYDVEAILSDRYNEVQREREFFVKFVGYDEPEWISESDVDSGPIYEAYKAKLERDAAQRRSEAQRATHRATRFVEEPREQPRRVAAQRETCEYCLKEFKQIGKHVCKSKPQ